MCTICGSPRSKHLRHWTEVQNHDRFNYKTKVPCKSCEGLKTVNGEPCQPCDGTGEMGIDMMPDGIHAKIYKFWEYNKTNNNRSMASSPGPQPGCSEVVRPAETRDERTDIEKGLLEEWGALPDPKPDFFEWGCDKSKPQVLLMLRDTAMNGRRLADRIKAADVLLKHGKVPPKQMLELSGPQDQVDLDALLIKICEVKNIPLEAIRPFLTVQ